MKTTQNVNIYHMRETIMFITTALVWFSTRVSQLSTWNFLWNLSFLFLSIFSLSVMFLLHQKWKLVHICKSFFYHNPRFFHHFFFSQFLFFTLFYFLLLTFFLHSLCCTLIFCVLRVYFYIILFFYIFDIVKILMIIIVITLR